MRRSTFLAGASVLALAFAVSQPALAQAPKKPASASPPSARDEAARHFQEGNKHFDAGRTADAVKSYTAAWELAKSFDVAANLGAAELRDGKPRKAAEHFTYAIENYPVTGAPEKKKLLEKLLGDAKALIGVVRLRVDAAGAEVSAGDRVLGTSPIAGEIFLDPGPQKLTATLAGHDPAIRELDVVAGSKFDVELTLTPTAAAVVAPPPPPTTQPAAPPPAGDEGPSMMPAVVGGVLGVAGLGVGIALVVVGGSRGGEADELRTSIRSDGGTCPSDAFGARCDEWQSAADSSNTLTTAGIVSIAVGGTALLATAAYYLFSGSDEPAPAQTGVVIKATPVLDPGYGGFLVRGTF